VTARATPSRAEEVLGLLRERDFRMVDVRFVDLLGAWHHFTLPAHQLVESAFSEGLGIDGSAIRGFAPVHRSDLVVVPDPRTARPDPLAEAPTLVLLADIREPDGEASHPLDPRGVARRAEAHLRNRGLATHAFFGPQTEFFVFDQVRVRAESHAAGYEVDAGSGHWNSDREEFPNLGYKARRKLAAQVAPPTDTFGDLRTEMCLVLEDVGLTTLRHHHEAASGGQSEIDLHYDTLLAQADALCWLKHVVKNVARRAGKTATFMPKPILDDNGSGMHTHISLWRDAEPLFAGEAGFGLSSLALSFVAGVLAHGPALCAFTNPTTNSYKRLVAGFGAPTHLAYSAGNRSVAVRIPAHARQPRSRRIELRTPDPLANPYLALSAILMAGIDGIERGLQPGEPLDADAFALDEQSLRHVPSIPASLEEALRALDADREFLIQGGVFDGALLDAWIRWKREHEVHEVRLRPHPHEFSLYFDG